MIEPATSIARKLRRDGRANRHATRYWAGWRLELTFGPYELAFDPARTAFAREAAAKLWQELHGTPPPSGPEADAESLESQRDLWHLSVSWRGGYPAASARQLLEELVVALGIPESACAGYQPARVYAPDGKASPQVTHWSWRDPTPLPDEP